MGDTWFDLTKAAEAPLEVVDVLAPWLNENEPPPGEATEVDQPPLQSDPTPPADHPGITTAAGPECPSLRVHIRRDPVSCGGLPGLVHERAHGYQLAAIADPSDWDAMTPRTGESAVRQMRQPSAVDIYRLLADYAHPDEVRTDGKFRDELLEQVLRPPSTDGFSHLHRWAETSDFMANGLLRLLYLYADQTWAPNPDRPDERVPLIPCELQWAAVEQLAGWKYFGDEPARRPTTPDDFEVYHSENHLVLFAVAEYLAGQLMPDFTFQPTAHVKDENGVWQQFADPAWAMTPDERMARAYPRLVRWLDHRLMFGFSEWNSPVYFNYDIVALLNLIDFCDAPAIVDKATIVLDVLMLELARFAGTNHGTGTAGRAYPSHKWSGWGSCADTLQILFGHWQVDERAESVLEDWRLQGAPAGAPRRANPFSDIWSVADSPGAHALATSQRYCIPHVVFAYAQPDPVGRFERSRVSLDFADGPAHGIDFHSQEGVLDWWSRGAYCAPQVVVGTRNLGMDWGAWHAFWKIPGLFNPPLPLGLLVPAAQPLAVESLGSCLTTANLALWREGDVALSSAQKFRVGQVGRQAHIWQASVGPYITVWSTYPAAEEADDSDGPNWWGGNASQPRVVQRDGALICMHDSTLFSWTDLKYGHRSHAYFPVQMFDEAWEVRRPDPDDDDNVTITDLLAGTTWQEPFGLNAERGGVWWFGRYRDDYIGLFSAKDDTQLLRSGRWADREILCEDRVNIFVCQVGTRATFGSFPQFVQACSTARIHVGKGVYQPSNPFVDIQCSYDVPNGQRLSMNLEDRYPEWQGQPFSDEGFPRWETPWSTVLWGERQYTIRGQLGPGMPVELHHDCVTGARSGNGL